MEIKAGQTVLISAGEYSDYFVEGPCRATQDVDTNEVLQEWKLRSRAGARWYSYSDLISWMFAKGLFEMVESVTWHLGDYGQLDIDD